MQEIEARERQRATQRQSWRVARDDAIVGCLKAKSNDPRQNQGMGEARILRVTLWPNQVNEMVEPSMDGLGRRDLRVAGEC